MGAVQLRELEQEESATREKAEQLLCDKVLLSDHDGHKMRHSEACTAAAAAHESVRTAGKEAAETLSNQKLAEARLEQARCEAHEADQALAAARERAIVEADLSLRTRTELE